MSTFSSDSDQFITCVWYLGRYKSFKSCLKFVRVGKSVGDLKPNLKAIPPTFAIDEVYISNNLITMFFNLLRVSVCLWRLPVVVAAQNNIYILYM